MRDALQRRVADALAADPREDDTIAVECFDNGYAVLCGPPGARRRTRARLRSTLSATVRSAADRDAAVAAAADVPPAARVEDEIRLVA
jgi:hypothetical protein